MAGRYCKAAPGASRFGFRPSRIPSPATPPIPGGALPQTKALLETGTHARSAPKPCPARTQSGMPKRSGMPSPCPGRATSTRMATPTRSNCPCPTKPSPVAGPRTASPMQSSRAPQSHARSRPASISGAKPQGYTTPKTCPATIRQTTGPSGLKPVPKMPCPSVRHPTSPKSVPCPAKPICPAIPEIESEESEDDSASIEAIVQSLQSKLKCKEEEEMENCVTNLKEMQSFRREFIFNSISPPRPVPPCRVVTPYVPCPNYASSQYITDEMLQARYRQFKRSGTKEQFYSNESDSDDDLDKIEPDYEIEELIEEEEELEEFIRNEELCRYEESKKEVAPCPIKHREETYSEEFFPVTRNDAPRPVKQREETYSEELFRVMRNGNGAPCPSQERQETYSEELFRVMRNGKGAPCQFQ